MISRIAVVASILSAKEKVLEFHRQKTRYDTLDKQVSMRMI